MPEDKASQLLKLTETLSSDYQSLVNETRRRHVPIKQEAERQIARLRALRNSNEELQTGLLTNNEALLKPFLDGCLTKQAKIVTISLTAIQRLITGECLAENSATLLIDVLWTLMLSTFEELKVLQTTILLLTATPMVRSMALAKALAICFRLYASKQASTVNTAAAAVRQCAGAVLDRATKDVQSKENSGNAALKPLRPDDVTSVDSTETLRPGAVTDAYMLFQDICLLLNDEPTKWLTDVTAISQSLGLELIESILGVHASLFLTCAPFAYLLKTCLCPVIIKLFSPSLELRSTPSGLNSSTLAEEALTAVAASNPATNRPSFALMVRLKRLIIVIVEQYFNLLNTECEIYLSLLTRFLSVDKILWQRALALEVLHNFCGQPKIIRHVCLSFDMRQHSTKIFQELVNALSHYVQTVITNTAVGDNPDAASPNMASGSQSASAAPNGHNQSMLYYKGVHFPIIQPKTILLDLLDRSEAPVLPEGYCLSVTFTCLLRIAHSIHCLLHADDVPSSVDDGPPKQLTSLSWTGLLSAFSIILEASADDRLTSAVLEAIQMMVGISGSLDLQEARNAFVVTMCKAALPSKYSCCLVKQHLGGDGGGGAPATSSLKSATGKSQQQQQQNDEAYERSPVVVQVTQTAGQTVSLVTSGVITTGSPTSGVPGSSSASASGAAGSSPAGVGDPPGASGNAAVGGAGSGSSNIILITAKHLLVARSVFNLAKLHGNVLGSTWNYVLVTAQQLVWMLNLRIEPSAQLFFKPMPEATATGTSAGNARGAAAGSTATGSTGGSSGLAVPAESSLITSATVTSELGNLSTLLSSVFIESSNLTESALNDLVLGLSHLSFEAMEAVSVNKEPSQFSIVKLTEVGLVNVHRLNLWWDSVCCQLLSVCKLFHPALRQLSANALVTLIKQAIAAPQTPVFWQNETVANLVLDQLSVLSEVAHDDVRERQLECVQHILHCWGVQVGFSWIRLIQIIGVIRDSFKIDLIQTAFQCFKLVVTDYLPSLPPNCYEVCVETAARFGRQKQDLNIALTAIGTILHLCDYLLKSDQRLPEPGPSLQELWIRLFCQLADLCLDSRLAVRKSACQTLFNTVECHSDRFDPGTWSSLFRQVLFPLVDKVRETCANAPVERDARQTSLLVHHSRDTPAKQWAETVLLTLSGVAHLCVSKQRQLLPLGEFPQFWTSLLVHIESHALTSNAEISVNGLESFKILLGLQDQPTGGASTTNLWTSAWETWLQIGTRAVHLQGREKPRACEGEGQQPQQQQQQQPPPLMSAQGSFLPTPSFLTLLFDLCVPVFSRTRITCLSGADFARLGEIIQLGVLTPLHVAALYPQACALVMPLVDDGALSLLQAAVLADVNFLVQHRSSPARQETTTSASSQQEHCAALIRLLLSLASYAVHIPKPGKPEARLEPVPLNYIMFSEKCLQTAVDFFLASASVWDGAFRREIMTEIVRTLHKPMALRYGCPSQSTWLLASACFFRVVTMRTSTSDLSLLAGGTASAASTGATLGFRRSTGTVNKQQQRGGGDTDSGLCDAIADTLHDFLFYQQQPPSTLSVELFQQHEELDCKFISLISDLLLSSPTQLPETFVTRLVNLLSLGSVQAAVSTNTTDVDDLSTAAGYPTAATSCRKELPYRSSLVESQNGRSNETQKKQQSPSDSRRLSRGLGIAVRQTSDPSSSLLSPGSDPLTDGVLNLDLDRLRQFAFRENFARLCFSRLLAHAFPEDVEGSARGGNKSVSMSVSRAAVRSILGRCRLILVNFFQASLMTGKCPLPRARLTEVAYVFRALTVMLTSLCSVSPRQDVDPSTWSHVIDIYPHLVDCILVAGNNQLTLSLHRLLRLYGDLLQPCPNASRLTRPGLSSSAVNGT